MIYFYCPKCEQRLRGPDNSRFAFSSNYCRCGKCKQPIRLRSEFEREFKCRPWQGCVAACGLASSLLILLLLGFPALLAVVMVLIIGVCGYACGEMRKF